MRGKNYTSAEDDAIRDMVNRRLPHKTIARHLNRPLLSIQKRAQRLNVSQPAKPAKPSKSVFYSDREIERIKDASLHLALYGFKGLKAAGGVYGELAGVLGRSHEAVSKKAQRLRDRPIMINYTEEADHEIHS